MNRTVGDMDEARDVAPQIQFRVHLDCSQVALVPSPGENRERQTDGRRVHGIHQVLQIDIQGVAPVQTTGFLNEIHREIAEDLPIAFLVGIGQSAAANTAVYAHVVELCLPRFQGDNDVAETVPEGQLPERHLQELIPASQRSDTTIAVVAPYTLSKLVPRKEVHELRKNGSS